MTRTYLNQFIINEEHPLTVPAFLLSPPWEDISWGNDERPSFFNHNLMLKVWVDFDRPEDREDEFTRPKFSATHMTVELDIVEGSEEHEFDTEEELLKFLSTAHNFDK